MLGSDIVGESRKIRARIGELSTPPDHPKVASYRCMLKKKIKYPLDVLIDFIY